jgi:phospholipid transport system substrate-binding protein
MSLQPDVTLPSCARRWLLAGSFLLPLLTSRGAAQNAPGPTDTLREFYAALLEIMKEGKFTPFKQRYDQLAPAVDAAFDLNTILQTSVGPGWDQIAPDQHAALLDAIRRYTIDSYVSNFDSFSGQRFEVVPEPRMLPSGEQVVSTQIIPASGDAHQLDYVMRRSDGSWKVVDVLADGTISRVATQRSDFRRLLMQGGAHALLESLQRKARDLEAG